MDRESSNQAIVDIEHRRALASDRYSAPKGHTFVPGGDDAVAAGEEFRRFMVRRQVDFTELPQTVDCGSLAILLRNGRPDSHGYLELHVVSEVGTEGAEVVGLDRTLDRVLHGLAHHLHDSSIE
jgi:hypothetical protein